MKWIDGGVTAASGYKASGVVAGIKPKRVKKDCALVLSDRAASVAGLFTTNVMKSPPVYWNIDMVTRGFGRAVFLNSGNANAATGEVGHRDVRTTAEAVARLNHIEPEEVGICSTGVIGVNLPMDRLLKGVEDATAALTDHGSLDAATAIMTTDKVAKERAIEVELSGGTVRIGGIAKGSGMLAPNMATMIAIITTDAAVSAPVLQAFTKHAVEASFNQISVDNDMSTSDTVLVFANGAAGLPEVDAEFQDAQKFTHALTVLCTELAKDLVKDGEGATKFVEIVVEGAENDDDAKRVARAIGLSSLCKTAFYGEDANWGRFACAAGYSGVDFDPNDLQVRLNDLVLCEKGLVAEYEEADAAAIMKNRAFQVGIRIGDGPGKAVFWTSDLSHDYVSINADYRT